MNRQELVLVRQNITFNQSSLEREFPLPSQERIRVREQQNICAPSPRGIISSLSPLMRLVLAIPRGEPDSSSLRQAQCGERSRNTVEGEDVNTAMEVKRSHLSMSRLWQKLSPSGFRNQKLLRLSIWISTFLTFSATFALSADLDETLAKRKPEAVIDLGKTEGVQLVKGEWRYSDTKIIEVDFRAAGADGQPGSTPNKAYDFTPHAGPPDFDDSKWEVIDPTTLDKRRSAGRLAFNWYRIKITVPEWIGNFNPAGSTVMFATSLDDYAEIWVDGEIPRAAGQSGGSVIKGWNAENRLIIARGVKPGQTIQLAILGINGPLSNPPTNYIWMRYAKLEFHKVAAGPIAMAPHEANVEIARLDPAIDAIVPANPKIFKLAEGFQFTEGPVWFKQGYLLFSDPNANMIYKYTAAGKLSVFKKNSGYSGKDIAEYVQPGSNGLTLDPQGRLTINEHGNRRVIRMEKDGKLTVLADRFEGKRLNSPNDLVYRSDGTLFITDPPFGLPKFYDDPRKELAYSGVFALYRGQLKLVSTDLKGPNGIAFSPDEKYLYVGNWDPEKKVVMRYEVNADATLSNGKVLFDMTKAPGEDALDGIKVDQQGNLYVSGPGGLWVISPQGKHLGTVIVPKHPHNMAWGGEDGKTLYMTSQGTLYRMPLKIPGIGPRDSQKVAAQR
jgi:gluconolactonase